ncbi:MAG TPA: apolipoprotein N-acyltransferase [Candidatus Nitrosopolaris sp.]|nr:apolipoprotein N-acyltransferase [Candidatus Nitrosopolaris sp.]
MSAAPGTAWRLACAVLAGVASVVALSVDGLSWIAWGALVPLFVALDRAPRLVTLLVTTTYAVVLGLGSLGPWLTRAIAAYFELGAGRAAAYTLPSLALLSAGHGFLLGTLFLARPRRAGVWDVLWCAALWTCWEAVRTFVFPYYPAAVLALSQHALPPVLQVASVCGIAGVTFILVAFNVGVASLLRSSAGTSAGSGSLLAALTGLVLAIGAVGWGMVRLSGRPPAAPGPAVVAVDVDAADQAASTLDRYLAASEKPAGARPRLLVWPESALTMDIEHDRAAWAVLDRFIESHGVPLLAGGPAVEPRSDHELAHFNSAHLIVPQHGMSSYHKRGLVPFAERWPAVFGSPPAGLASLDAGSEATVFHLGADAFGVLICFEIADGALARALVRNGAEFIVTLTNDAWFGERAPHRAWAQVRAVETGLPVLRAANAGSSVLFDRFGRELRDSAPDGGPSLLTVEVPAGAPTLYARTGDVFLVGCLVVVLVGVMNAWRSPGTRWETIGASPRGGDSPRRGHPWG